MALKPAPCTLCLKSAHIDLLRGVTNVSPEASPALDPLNWRRDPTRLSYR